MADSIVSNGGAVVTDQRCSAMGARWDIAEISQRDIAFYVQRLGLPELLVRILLARGVGIDDVPVFLQPKIRDLLPDPFHFLDMDKAVDRIVAAIARDEKLAVFGDYDVDGATSSAVLIRFFRALGKEITVYIPDRVEEGYGLNTNAMLALRKQGVDVCITVDCGTLSVEPIAKAKEAGLDTVVIDHHLGADTLPDAVAVVNPNRLDEPSEYGYLAAVGMTFMLVVAVNKRLKETGFYDDKTAPDLLSLLDLVALGTVCDVVSLHGVNRGFVSQGLRVLQQRNNLGLKALGDIASVDETPGVYHLGFVYGPRINAGGRVGEAGLGARLLSTEDANEAYDIAGKLHKYNTERQAIEQLVLDEAICYVEQQGLDKPLLFAIGKDWHQGVIGIVAGRLKERYHKPVAVISVTDGVGKASARSITGVDFGAAIVSANLENMLIAGGGHAMAAGFSVEEGKIDTLYDFLCGRFAQQVAANSQRVISIDAHLTVNGVTVELISKLHTLGPFGVGNREPKFIFHDVLITKADIISADHVRCFVKDGRAGGSGKSIKAMAFKCLETPLGKALLSSQGKTVDMVGRIKVNEWQGRQSVEMLVEDVAL